MAGSVGLLYPVPAHHPTVGVLPRRGVRVRGLGGDLLQGAQVDVGHLPLGARPRGGFSAGARVKGVALGKGGHHHQVPRRTRPREHRQVGPGGGGRGAPVYLLRLRCVLRARRGEPARV